MFKRRNKILCVLLVSIIFLFALTFEALGGSLSSEISGRMAVTYDKETGVATGMVAGYSQGDPVTIGPSTFPVGEGEFSGMKAEDAAKSICGNEFSIRRVTKSKNNGKEMVADVVLVRN